MAMLPYPVDLPPETLQLAIDALRGKADVPKDIHAVWHVIGFGLGKLVPDQLVATRSPMPELSDAVAADYLDQVKVSRGAVEAVIPWELVLPVLLRLALRWLT